MAQMVCFIPEKALRLARDFMVKQEHILMEELEIAQRRRYPAVVIRVTHRCVEESESRKPTTIYKIVTDHQD